MAFTFKHFLSLVSYFFSISLALSAAIETSNTYHDIIYNNNNNNGLGEEKKKFEIFKSKLKFINGHNSHDLSSTKGHVADAYDQGQLENHGKKALQKAKGGKSDEVACDSYNSCPSNHTCCCTYTYGPYCFTWGCCPLESGVCCADDPSQCCPRHHPICDASKGTCTKNKNSQLSSKALKLTLA